VGFEAWKKVEVARRQTPLVGQAIEEAIIIVGTNQIEVFPPMLMLDTNQK
jgi:hypothetical protein